jgi:hypothetical protein
MDKNLKEKIVKTFKDYLGDSLVSIVLFGSHARGDARKASDYDLFIVANKLPESPLKRTMFIRRPLVGKFKEKLAIVAKTKKEVEESFPPLFLDLGLDGVILYDDNFFNEKLKRILQIIKEAGLRRKRGSHGFYWEWEKRPKRGWQIDWSGYREF